MKLLYPTLALLALSSAALAQTPPPAPPQIVVVMRAIAPPSAVELVLPGTIEAWQETPIYARTDGYVRRWYAEIGDRVKAGALLVELDTPEVDQALLAARAALAQAQANLELARLNFERWQTLVARKMVPKSELDERAASFKARGADVAAARANQQRYEELAGFKRVTAPFAGTVVLRQVENGALIDSGSHDTHEMYRLAETTRLRIRVGVPQTNLRAIVPGLAAEVRVAEFPGQRFNGQVVRTAGAIEPASRTLLTEIELPNADNTLLPGLYAQVAFHLSFAGSAVLVPTNTVRFDSQGAHLATVDDSGAIRLRAVTLGRNLGTQFEVVEGLAANTRVVLNPTDLLREGVQVEVREPPPVK